MEKPEVNRVDRTAEHMTVCKELNEIYRHKNHDYGDSFHESWKWYGLTMAAIRIGDKYNRLKTLVNSESEVQDETIMDTLMDLANYAIMTVMEMDTEREEHNRR